MLLWHLKYEFNEKVEEVNFVDYQKKMEIFTRTSLNPW